MYVCICVFIVLFFVSFWVFFFFCNFLMIRRKIPNELMWQTWNALWYGFQLHSFINLLLLLSFSFSISFSLSICLFLSVCVRYIFVVVVPKLQLDFRTIDLLKSILSQVWIARVCMHFKSTLENSNKKNEFILILNMCTIFLSNWA